MSGQIDDEASGILERLSGERLEHIGLVIEDDNGVRSTKPMTARQRASVKANIIIPKGSLRALFHNHPATRQKRDLVDEGGAEDFSMDDKMESVRLGVPSYIITPSRRVLKFDPRTGKTIEVLAQLDLSSIRSKYKPEVVRTSGTHNTLTASTN